MQIKRSGAELRTALGTGIWLVFILLATLTVACGPAPEPASVDTGENHEPVVIPTRDSAKTLSTPLCSEPQSAYVVGLEVHVPPRLREPEPRAPFHDPTFGSCLVRVTERTADLSPQDESRGLKNEYARVNAFNADETAILVYGTEGEWFLYSAATLQPLGSLPLGVEPRWDAQDANLIYYNDGSRLVAFHLETGQATTIRDFALDLTGQSPTAVWMAYEGRPSMDTRYWGLMAEDDNWLPIAFLVYDRLNDSVTVRDITGIPGIEDDVDHVTISPLGTYFLASFDRACDQGKLGDDAHPCGLVVYDRELRHGRGLLRIVGHYDVALSPDGREIVVYQDIDSDHLSMLDLETGAVTPLWPIDFSHSPLGFHFSGLAYETPGWALVSTYSGGYPDAYTWMDDQVFAVELRAGGRVVRLAHTHSLVDEDQEHDYWAEPHATVNRDFTRVLFTSNWGRSGSESVEMYLIELPVDWIDNLP